MSYLAKVTSKGQVTIPAEVRARLGAEAGDRLCFTVDDSGAVTVEKVTLSLAELRGMVSDLPRLSPGEAVAAVDEARAARADALTGRRPQDGGQTR
ncbi:MAG TPA: AbrB family transcriptional regulator [Rhodobacteraceae bacterium]|jgi:antitoxin PrlF|nr:AbrB/MazE/SpoVT family DNA-binding domain-containing protein [Paracoccaceae bacterium]HBG98401.1 AbrB family transcriptional regulator [Paracoccaceae bacterium]